MIDPQEFEKLVLSHVEKGPFKPLATYEKDDDALEVVISSETYRIQTVEGNRSANLYIGRNTGEIVGVRVTGVSDFALPFDQVHFVVQDGDGTVKGSYLLKLFRAIREKTKNEHTTLGIFIGMLEKKMKELGLEDPEEPCEAKLTV